LNITVNRKPLENYWNKETVDELLGWPGGGDPLEQSSFTIVEKYTLDEIIERFNPSEETIAHIKKIQNGE